MRGAFPKIYPILDSSVIPLARRDAFLNDLGKSLASAGVPLLEYRNKLDADSQVFADALILRAAMPEAKLIMDDRVDVALAAQFDGVHVDAGDLPIAVARNLLLDEAIVGTSASTESDLVAAITSGADYIAFGPVFPTTTKHTSAVPIGIEGVRRFRSLAGQATILVAAAGITLETAPAILAAGANTVAVSAAIFRSPDPAAEFRRWIAVLGAD
jgi:thiamine-phosphate pyrophosphorylase